MPILRVNRGSIATRGVIGAVLGVFLAYPVEVVVTPGAAFTVVDPQDRPVPDVL